MKPAPTAPLPSGRPAEADEGAGPGDRHDRDRVCHTDRLSVPDLGYQSAGVRAIVRAGTPDGGQLGGGRSLHHLLTGSSTSSTRPLPAGDAN